MKSFEIKKILVPLDFSTTSLNALEYAVALAKRTNAEITLLHAIEHVYVTTDPRYAIVPPRETINLDLDKISKDSLTKVAEKLKRKGVAKVNTLSVSGRTHKEIIRVGKKLKADLIVMGTHGVSGFREFVMGSNTYRVVSDSLCPVLSVQKSSKITDFKTILVPFSDAPHSREKVMYAINIAEIYGAELHILGIDSEYSKAHSKKIALEAAQINKIVERHNLSCKVNVLSAPYNSATVLSYAKKIKAELVIIMGDTEKQNIAEYFTGSFSQQIINHATIPILSIHSNFNPNTVELWQGL
jgi:nucleotide-binding universal stress UspA family protein